MKNLDTVLLIGSDMRLPEFRKRNLKGFNVLLRYYPNSNPSKYLLIPWLQLSKQSEQACKERDAMVMKYAVSENNVINLQRQIKQLENKLKEKGKEKESVEGKINVAIGEKAKLSQLVNTKVSIDRKCVTWTDHYVDLLSQV